MSYAAIQGLGAYHLDTNAPGFVLPPEAVGDVVVSTSAPSSATTWVLVGAVALGAVYAWSAIHEKRRYRSNGRRRRR